MGKRSSGSSTDLPSMQRPPARSAEEQENRLIAMAYDEAEKRLANGTASSQMITQLLKSGSRREQLEQRNKELENELLIAKTESLKSAERVEEQYAKVIAAMKSYGGYDDE